MAKRQRSPDYPGLSLREAVDKARLLHESIGQNPTSREVVATSMGYRGLSGASAAAVAALKKYGLLEGRGEEIRVSDRAMAILYAHSAEERAEALREAAVEPALFREMSERFRGPNLVDDLLRNYLLRNGYTPQAVASVISAYRDTVEFVRGEAGGYDSAVRSITSEAPPMRQPASVTPVTRSFPVAPSTTSSGGVSEPGDVKIGELGFAGVGFVKILASPNLDPRKALGMAKQVISMMELALADQEASTPQPPARGEEEEEEDNSGEHNT